MSAPREEIFVFGCDWPTQPAEQEEFLRGLPAVMWDQNPDKALFIRTFGFHLQTVELAARRGRGHRTYQVWNCLNFTAIFREAPPTLIINASLEARGQVVSVELSLASGEALAGATFDLKPGEPLIMGHVTMIAYKGATDARLLESIYQDVRVLLEGSASLVPDGVVLWERSRRGRPRRSLAASLERVQRLAPEELAALDMSYLPGFVGPVLDELKQLVPSYRLLPWLAFTGNVL